MFREVFPPLMIKGLAKTEAHYAHGVVGIM